MSADNIKLPRSYDGTEPKLINGCKFYTRWRHVPSDTVNYRVCGKCNGCRYHRHNVAVAKASAEAESAACVLSLTLTYRNNPDGSVPDSAVHLDYDDLRRFWAYLRADGYKFRKVWVGEYGNKNGRGHWHTLVYFQWDDEHLALWREDFISQKTENYATLCSNWDRFVPPIAKGYFSDPSEFKALLKNPEILYCEEHQHKKLAGMPQVWRYWPHGNVQCEIVKAPGVGNDAATTAAIRYLLKYYSKDSWHDGKLSHLPFDELPEWVRQNTAYGPWELDEKGRIVWQYGNPYRKKLEAKLLAEFANDADVPVERRIRVPRAGITAKGGLGSHYFEAEGAFYGRVAGGEKHVKRTFELGPSFKSKDREKAKLRAQGFATPAGRPALNKHYMNETALLSFAKGFNKERVALGLEPYHGPDDIWLTLKAKRARAAERASGPVWWHIWRKADQEKRKQLETDWSYLSEDVVKQMIPRDQFEIFKQHSKLGDWPRKRLEAKRFAHLNRQLPDEPNEV